MSRGKEAGLNTCRQNIEAPKTRTRLNIKPGKLLLLVLGLDLLCYLLLALFRAQVLVDSSVSRHGINGTVVAQGNGCQTVSTKICILAAR